MLLIRVASASPLSREHQHLTERRACGAGEDSSAAATPRKSEPAGNGGARTRDNKERVIQLILN